LSLQLITQYQAQLSALSLQLVEANANIYRLKIEKMEASEISLIKQLRAAAELKISGSISYKETVTTTTTNTGTIAPKK